MNNHDYTIRLIIKYILFFLFGWSNLTFAQSPDVIILKKGFHSKFINKNFYLYDEAVGKKETISEILNKTNVFVESKTMAASYFANYAGHWIKFNLKSEVSQEVIIDLGVFSIDEFEGYLVQNNEVIQALNPYNWQTPITQRPLKTEKIGYQISLPKHQTFTVYIRAKSPKGSLRLPITLSETTVFFKNETKKVLFFSYFLGITTIVVLLSFAFFFISRDFSYLYYSLFVLSLVIHNAILGGYLIDFLLKYIPSLADPLYANAFTPFFGVFHVLFLQKLLIDPTQPPKFYVLYRNTIFIISIYLLVIMAVSLYNDGIFKWLSYSFYVYYSLLLLNLIITITLGFIRNPNNALFISLSNTPFIVYIFLLILTNLKIIPQFLPLNALLWCLLFDIIILCIGLSFRFRSIAKRELELQKQVNVQLSRTFEVERQHQQEQLKRLEAQYKLQIEKERISRDLHDNIGSQLAFITANIDYYSQKITTNPEHQQKLASLSDYVRTTTQQLRDTIWAINKETIQLNDFVKRIQGYVSKHLENQSISFSLSFDENNNNLVLTSPQALNLFRVLQECINNIGKHSQSDRVGIDVVSDGHLLKLMIWDNGVGFDPNQHYEDHYGLQNIVSRIEEINGKVEIKSVLGTGTSINIQLDTTEIRQNTY
ncbi:MAG: histidine kinase [Spirosomaceae bacterium]|nr:histidine kinase [Spirosomataceae bacterium]